MFWVEESSSHIGGTSYFRSRVLCIIENSKDYGFSFLTLVFNDYDMSNQVEIV